jgi:hypothetical protein
MTTTANAPDVNGMTRLDAALFYASKGWPVVPLHNPVNGKCSCSKPDECKSPAKHPRTEHGLKDATVDGKTIRRWWRTWPDANIAVVTGPESGLLVLDVDREPGERTLSELIHQHGRPPETLKAATGGGGRHILFVYPGGVDIRNSAGKLGEKLDTRGVGGYIVAAPSVHISGQPYRWLADPSTTKIASPPQWLLDLARAPKQA